MTTLHRITLEYIATEDRVRLSGERAGRQPVSVWLTRRLLDRLIPVLTQWIEHKGADELGARVPRADVWNSFAQEAARSKQRGQSTERVQAAADAWLAQSVDVGRSDRAIRLTFKSGSGESASVTMGAPLLRQWLNILQDTYRRANWPMQAWPEWLRVGDDTPDGQPIVRH